MRRSPRLTDPVGTCTYYERTDGKYVVSVKTALQKDGTTRVSALVEPTATCPDCGGRLAFIKLDGIDREVGHDSACAHVSD